MPVYVLVCITCSVVLVFLYELCLTFLFSLLCLSLSVVTLFLFQNYAVQQATNYATKTMMEQMAAQMAQNNQFTNAAVPPGSPRQTSRPATSPSPATSQSAVTVDVTATEVEAPPATDVKDNTEIKQPKRPGIA